MSKCMVEGCNRKAEYTIYDVDGKELKLCSEHLIEKLNKDEFCMTVSLSLGGCEKCG